MIVNSKSVARYARKSPIKRLAYIRVWVRTELQYARTYILSLMGYSLDQDNDVGSLLQYSLDDLPLELNNFDVGTPEHAIITHRLKHALAPEDCQDNEPLEWEDFIQAVILCTEDPSYMLDNTDIKQLKDLSNKLYDLRELATLSGDQKLVDMINLWYFNID